VSTAAAQPANPIIGFRIVLLQSLDVCATVLAAKYKVNFVSGFALRLLHERYEAELPRDLIVRSPPGIVGKIPLVAAVRVSQSGATRRQA
jgi:hypothetical protein